MIDNKTYNNVINTLKNLGDNHHQISTTKTGDIYDIDMNNTLFPLFHITFRTYIQLSAIYYGCRNGKRELEGI